MHRCSVRFAALSSVALVGLAACDRSAPTSLNSTDPPANPPVASVTGAIAGSGTDNVLAARLAFTAAGADSVRVVYRDPAGNARFTPFHPATTGADTVLVLGLQPSTSYSAAVEAVTGGVSTESPAISFQTAALPSDVASFAIREISGKQSAYAATGLNVNGGAYAVLFDSTGHVAWYRDLTAFNVPVSNVVQQPNGNITAFLGGTAGWQPRDGFYVEITPAGEIVHTYRAPAGFYMDNHELQLTGSGASLRAHYFTYDIRTIDLSDVGGSATAKVAGHQIVRADAAGNIEFTWNSWDHFTFEDKVGEEEGAALDGTDFDHSNALSFDPSGNYIASWRDLNQVTALDPRTGAVLWKIGGVRGEYTFVNDGRDGFSKQHYARVLANGNLILYDNGNDLEVPESRAVEYRIDPVARTATLVWEYKHSPAIWTQYVGNVNRLTSGTTWIGFAGVGRAVEASASGETLWEGQVTIGGADASVYRIVPVRSLYGYTAP